MTGVARRAALAMYALAPIRPAVEALWSALRARVDWLSAELEWDVDLHELWTSPALEVSQACGWPLVTSLAPLVRRGDVHVVGAFVYDIAQADGPTYRSVLVAREPVDPGALRMHRAAVNGFDSLSGWVSLRWGALGGAGEWPGTVVVTGAHLDSLRAVVDGEADLASLDAVTWALLERHHPELTERVVVVGNGPRVPCLPLIAGPVVGAAGVDELRAALGSIAADPAASAIRSALLIDGFVPLDGSAYEGLHSLA